MSDTGTDTNITSESNSDAQADEQRDAAVQAFVSTSEGASEEDLRKGFDEAWDQLPQDDESDSPSTEEDEDVSGEGESADDTDDDAEYEDASDDDVDDRDLEVLLGRMSNIGWGADKIDLFDDVRQLERAVFVQEQDILARARGERPDEEMDEEETEALFELPELPEYVDEELRKHLTSFNEQVTAQVRGLQQQNQELLAHLNYQQQQQQQRVFEAQMEAEIAAHGLSDYVKSADEAEDFALHVLRLGAAAEMAGDSPELSDLVQQAARLRYADQMTERSRTAKRQQASRRVGSATVRPDAAPRGHVDDDMTEEERAMADFSAVWDQMQADAATS